MYYLWHSEMHFQIIDIEIQATFHLIDSIKHMLKHAQEKTDIVINIFTNIISKNKPYIMKDISVSIFANSNIVQLINCGLL